MTPATRARALRTRVKICCISSPGEAQLAVHHGADVLGLVGSMPSGPGVISDEDIAEIAAAAPPGVATFLLTSETKADRIVDHHRRVRTTAVQLVDRVEDDDYATLRRDLPGVGLVQVVHVLDETSVREALLLAQHVDALLLDSGNPTLAVKELGGTGRVHDWALSQQIVQQSPVPVYLAGGLRATNVVSAIDTGHPFGLDLCSSVRTDGKLDEVKLADFFAAVRPTFA